MKLRPIDKKRVEQNITQVSRIPIIDSAVGRLEVQMEELTARIDSYDEIMVAVNNLFTDMLNMLKEVKESADDN